MGVSKPYFHSTMWVMLSMFFVVIQVTPTKAQQALPKKSGVVNDAENDLEMATIVQLNKLIEEHKTKTTNEIGVVTTAAFAPYKTIDEYSQQLLKIMALGAAKNNGVLIIVSQAKNDARVIAGSALQQKLGPAACQKIVNERMKPKLSEGNVDQSAINAVMEVIRILESKQ